MIQKDDWRLKIPNDTIKKEKNWVFKTYVPKSKTWEHEHCEFCGDKISQYANTIHAAYTSTSDYREDYWWICPTCFSDFKEMFGWEVIE